MILGCAEEQIPISFDEAGYRRVALELAAGYKFLQSVPGTGLS